MGGGLSGAVLKSARERAALGTRMLSAAEVRGTSWCSSPSSPDGPSAYLGRRTDAGLIALATRRSKDLSRFRGYRSRRQRL
jgi:hypothetical protein